MMQPDDENLAQQAAAGDRRAMDRLVLKYQSQVRRLVGSILQNEDDAEDASQEVWIRVWRALPQFRGDSAFYTWLYRIAVNTALKVADRRTRESVEELDEASLGGGETPEEVIERREAAMMAVEALEEHMPPLLAAAVRLHEAGLSYVEVANVFGWSPVTLRSRLHKARREVKEKLWEP